MSIEYAADKAMSDIHKLQDIIDRLNSELQQAQQDARRYHILRDRQRNVLITLEQYDAYVDAIAASPVEPPPAA